eukprot:364808-Chlamydomonas_euryale.AAC.17
MSSRREYKERSLLGSWAESPTVWPASRRLQAPSRRARPRARAPSRFERSHPLRAGAFWRRAATACAFRGQQLPARPLPGRHRPPRHSRVWAAGDSHPATLPRPQNTPRRCWNHYNFPRDAALLLA